MNEHGLQCGFCTPGMMMTARWLLDHNPDPSEAEIREAISRPDLPLHRLREHRPRGPRCGRPSHPPPPTTGRVVGAPA